MSDFLRKIFSPVIPKSAREYRLFAVNGFLCVLLVVLDQWTKIIIEKTFAIRTGKVVIQDLFNIVYVTNPGAAWGIMAGKWGLLLFIAVTAMLLCIIFFRKITENYPERFVAMAFLVAGIIGNSIDRVWRGEVVDFLDFYIRMNGKAYHWPAFNVADIAICCGVGIYILSNLIRKENKEEEK